MSEPRFREIQLTSKQLVFLFMASVVVAVSIFLLGVSVGRGVRDTTQVSAEPAAAQPGAIDVPARMPPATQTTPADLSYHARLQGQAPPPAQTPATSTPGPAVTEPGRPAPEPPRPSDQRQPAPAPARTASPPATPPGGGFFVQTDAFSARGSADKRAAELKSKGHAAFVVLPGPPFRVRIGPFAGRAEAERTASQLRAEGLKPSVTR